MAIGAGGHTLRERPVMGAYDNMVICSRRPFFFAAAEAKIRRADRQRQNGFSKCCWNHLLNESLRFVSVSDAPSGLSDRHFAALGTNAPRPVSGTVRARTALPDSPTGRCAIPLRRGFPPASRETLTRLPGDLLRDAGGGPPEIDGLRGTAPLRVCLRLHFRVTSSPLAEAYATARRQPQPAGRRAAVTLPFRLRQTLRCAQKRTLRVLSLGPYAPKRRSRTLRQDVALFRCGGVSSGLP